MTTPNPAPRPASPQAECPTCHGTGEACKFCDGYDWRRCTCGLNGFQPLTCPYCDGEGRVYILINNLHPEKT
jgi:RecJ-like exonuclease